MRNISLPAKLLTLTVLCISEAAFSNAPLVLREQSGIAPDFSGETTRDRQGYSLAAKYPSMDRTLAVSTFDVDNDGWLGTFTVNSPDNVPTVLHTFVPAFDEGGFIQVTEPDANAAWFGAPAQFLGDKGAAFGGTLTYELAVSNAGPPTQFPGLILSGAGLSLFLVTEVPRVEFPMYSISLVPQGWRVGDYLNGPEPTVQQLRDVLKDLNAIYILADWDWGAETASLENVLLMARQRPPQRTSSRAGTRQDGPTVLPQVPLSTPLLVI